MNYYKVTITFVDGTTKTVDDVWNINTTEGALCLSRRVAGRNVHLGSFPFANLREWKQEER